MSDCADYNEKECGWCEEAGGTQVLGCYKPIDSKAEPVADVLCNVGLEPAALAKRFHETYEKLAPHYNYETRKESAVPWDEVPENNKALMIATCASLLKQGL